MSRERENMKKTDEITGAVRDWFYNGIDLSRFEGLLDGETAAKNALDPAEQESANTANKTRNDWLRWAAMVDETVWPDRDVVMAILRCVPFTQIAGCVPIIVPVIEHYLRKTVAAKAQELDSSELYAMLSGARRFDVELAMAKHWSDITSELERGNAAVDVNAYKEEFAHIATACYSGLDAEETPPQEP